MPEYGEEDVTLDSPFGHQRYDATAPAARLGSPAGQIEFTADRRIELPVNLPAVRRSRTSGAGWFVVGFLVAACLGLAIWVLVAFAV